MDVAVDFKTIIDISGVPRSGTSWLSQIFDSSEEIRLKFQPLFSNSFKNYISLDSTRNEILNYYNMVYHAKDDYLDRTYQKLEGIYPTFEKRKIAPEIISTKNVTHHYLIPHLLNLIPSYNIIGIIRNPCAVLLSFKNYRSDFNPEWSFSDEWEFSPQRGEFKPENYFGYHKWKEYVKMMMVMKVKYSKRVYLLRYEELFFNAQLEVEKLFDFFNIKVGEQTLEYVKQSREIHQEGDLSVFKGKKNLYSWKDDLNDDVISKIERDLKGSEFEQFLI